jgi:hypothetical protein
MMVTQPRSIYLLIVALSLAACESLQTGLEKADDAFLKRDPQILLDDGATRLNAAQVKAHVSGNTEFWKQGTIFYNPDGQLVLVWQRIKSSGSWEITADGNVCFSVPTWEDRCHYYLDLDGTITIVRKDKIHGVSKVEQGDKSLR